MDEAVLGIIRIPMISCSVLDFCLDLYQDLTMELLQFSLGILTRILAGIPRSTRIPRNEF